MAATLTMTPVKKAGESTVMRFKKVTFDHPIEERVFSQENLMRAGTTL
jgi:hypothetical protein